MAKSRVGVRLKDAVGGGKSHNRSADLEQLTSSFNVLKKRIATLIAALKNHHASMMQLSKTRLQVCLCQAWYCSHVCRAKRLALVSELDDTV